MGQLTIQDPATGKTAVVQFDGPPPSDSDIQTLVKQAFPGSSSPSPTSTAPYDSMTPQERRAADVVAGISTQVATDPLFNAILGKQAQYAPTINGNVADYMRSTAPIPKGVPQVPITTRADGKLQAVSGSPSPDSTWGVPGSPIYNDAAAHGGVSSRTFDPKTNTTTANFRDGSTATYGAGGSRQALAPSPVQAIPPPQAQATLRQWTGGAAPVKNPVTFPDPQTGQLTLLDRSNPASVKAYGQSLIAGAQGGIAQTPKVGLQDYLDAGKARLGQNLQAAKSDVQGIGTMLQWGGESLLDSSDPLRASTDLLDRQQQAAAVNATAQDTTKASARAGAAIKGFLQTPSGEAVTAVAKAWGGDPAGARAIVAKIPSELWTNAGNDPANAALVLLGVAGTTGAALGKVGELATGLDRAGTLIDAAANSGRISPTVAAALKTATQRIAASGPRLQAIASGAEQLSVGEPIIPAAVSGARRAARAIRNLVPEAKLPPASSVEDTLGTVASNASNIPSAPTDQQPRNAPQPAAEPVVPEAATPRPTTPEPTPVVPAQPEPLPVANAPINKPLYEMSHAELENLHEIAENEDLRDFTSVFGPEGAKLYKKLDRQSNSSNLDRADKAYAEIERMRAGLTPQQLDVLDGITPGHFPYTVDDIEPFLSSYRNTDFATPEGLADALKYAITQIGPGTDPAAMTLREQRAYGLMKNVMMAAKEQGFDTQTISEMAVHAAAQRFGNPADAADVLERFIKPGTPAAPTRAALAAPEAAPTPPRAALGAPSSGVAYTADNEPVSYHWDVVPASRLITSHDENFAPNPKFDQSLQPRDRSRIASADQVLTMARQLNPQRLGESASTADGAPVVGPDLQVESGNGRTMAIKTAYSHEGASAQAYRDFVQQQAERLGLDRAKLAGMKNPVLVRVRDTATASAGERAALADRMGRTGVATMSEAETAINDGRKLREGTLLDQIAPAGELTGAANRDFVRGFLETLTPAERASMVQGDGTLSVAGARRIRNAVLGAAYDDPATISRLTESPDDNVRSVGQAMLSAAPKFARLKQAMAAGSRYPDLDLTPDVVAAANTLSHLRSTGTSVPEHLAQLGLFGNDLSPAAQELLSVFDRYKRQPARISDILDTYATAADKAGDPSNGNLFGEEPPSKDSVLTAALQRVEERHEQTGKAATQETLDLGAQAQPGARGSNPASPTEAGSGAEAQAPSGGNRPVSSEGYATTIRELDAMPGPNTPARIKPSPLPGGEPKRLSQIILDLGKSVERKVNIGKSRRGAAGVYFPGSAKTQIRFANDLDTTAHEIAHALDDRYGIVAAWNQPRKRSPFDSELKPFWEAGGSATKSGPRARLAYKRAEGVAEWIRGYLVNPNEAIARAPQFYQHVLIHIPSETMEKLHQFSRDIREFAGLPAHEKIGANAALTAARKPLTQQLQEALKGQGWDFETTGLNKLQAAVQDRLKPFTAAVEAARDMRGLGQPLPADDPILLARLHAGGLGKVLDILEHGMIDANNNRVTKGGLKWLMEPLDTSSPAALNRDLQDTVKLMVAERTIEKTDQLGRSRVTGIGGGIYSDKSVAQAAIKELRADPARYAKLEEGAKRYREWADSLLRYQVQKGRLGQKAYDAIKQNNEYYVALQRQMDTLQPPRRPGRPTKLGAVKETIHGFQGSTRTIENPYDTLVGQTHDMITEADRNEVLSKFRDLLTSPRDMHEGSVLNLSSIGHRARAGDDNTIRIWSNGKEEHWQFEPGVHATLKGFGADVSLHPLLTYLPALLRSSVTHSPSFLVRNLIRDTIERKVTSNVGSGVLDVLKKTPEAQKQAFNLAGGNYSGHLLNNRSDYARAMASATRELVGDPRNIIVRTGANFLERYKHLAHQSELANRYAEYRKAFDVAKHHLGYDDYNAALYAAGQARGLLDFAIAGNIGRMVNQIVPFTNAALQGTTRLIRLAKTNPRVFWGRTLAYVVLPEVAVYMWNRMQGKQTADEYRQLPAYQRDLFWNLKVGNDTWLRIPKGFELAVLASGVSRAIDRIEGNNHAFDGYGKDLVKSFVPVDEQAALSGPFPAAQQAASNYDQFRDKNIVPPYEANLRMDLRKGTSQASRLGQALGKVMGADPREIDFLMNGQFGDIGKLAGRVSDIGRPDRPQAVRSALEQAAGIFTESPAAAAPDVQAVMQDAQAVGRPNPLRARLNAYYAAQTSAQRDLAATSLREYASQIRPQWDRLANQPTIPKRSRGSGVPPERDPRPPRMPRL